MYVFSIDREQSLPGIAAASFAAYLYCKSSTIYNIQQAAWQITSYITAEKFCTIILTKKNGLFLPSHIINSFHLIVIDIVVL